MEALTALVIFSGIIWYVVDKFKPLWEKAKLSPYITIVVVGVLGAMCVFTFNLDIVSAFNLFDKITLTGQIITVLALMTGSSGIAEIIERVKV